MYQLNISPVNVGGGGNPRFKSDVFNDRLKQGVLIPDEVDRMFHPPKYDIENILRSPTTKGFVGFILSLDGCLVDISSGRTLF